MKKQIPWILFFFFACLGIILWYQQSYSQLTQLNFSIDRPAALNIAKKYLTNAGFDIQGFKSATVFNFDDGANRFLQKTIGVEGTQNFIKEHNLDMFFWIIRFFKENTKEEFRLTVSSATGEITSFRHIIEDTAARETITREEAQQKVEAFLKDQFAFDPSLYSIKGDVKNTFDHREDFSFSWQKNSVKIPWDTDENKGTGKLVTGALVSGNEILGFSKNSFLVPDEFSRHMEKLQTTSHNINTVVRIFYYALFIGAVLFVIKRRNHLAMHLTKRFYVTITLVIFVLMIFDLANEYQILLFNYPTTSDFESYLWRFFINTIVGTFFYAIAFVLPCLAGELLAFEDERKETPKSFLYYLQSSFLTREAAQQIILGYLVCIILLGLQSVLIYGGRIYFGVWTEYTWIKNVSTTYLPFFAAITMALRASFSEETMFRLFSIHFGKKLFKSAIVAVIFSSLIWGFAHSGYPVYPMWFRGVEVTILGLFLSFIYLRFGIISVIVAHFLFDVFWYNAGFLFGAAKPFYFYSTLIVLLLPLFWAIIAFIQNKPVVLNPLRWKLNRQQLYNLDVLKTFINANRDRFLTQSDESIKKEIIANGWDVAVVDIALEDFRK